MRPVKVATYNINGIRSRLPQLLDWLAREAPDIVCLQELKATDAAFPVDAIRAAGYGALWVGQTAWNGVAILARDAEPIASLRALPGDRADSHSRYLEAAVDGMVVVCLYLPNGNPQPGPKFDYKLAWFRRLSRHAKKLLAEKVPVVLAGDFNVAPTEIDIYPTTSWDDDALVQPQPRAAYARLIAQGWADALRETHGQERVYTFWHYLRRRWERNAGLRLDHILLSPDVAPRLRAAGVDRAVRGRTGASDHAPVWVELDMPKGYRRPS
jgi:exodeoxyribonuclease-3